MTTPTNTAGASNLHHGLAIADLMHEDGTALRGLHFTFAFKHDAPIDLADVTDEQWDSVMDHAGEAARMAIAPFLSYRGFLHVSHVDVNPPNGERHE